MPYQTARYLLTPLTIPDSLTVQEIHIVLGHWDQRSLHTVVVAYGVNDRMNTSYIEGDSAATFCNKPWGSLFQRTGIQPSDLWLPGAVCYCHGIYLSMIFIAAAQDPVSC